LQDSDHIPVSEALSIELRHLQPALEHLISVFAYFRPRPTGAGRETVSGNKVWISSYFCDRIDRTGRHIRFIQNGQNL